MARTGRPKMDDPHSYKLTVRFSNEQKKRLEAYAEKFTPEQYADASRQAVIDMRDDINGALGK